MGSEKQLIAFLGDGRAFFGHGRAALVSRRGRVFRRGLTDVGV